MDTPKEKLDKEQKQQTETRESLQENGLPAWISMELKESWKISLFVVVRDLVMVLIESYRKKHPRKEREISSRSYGIRLVVILAIVFALVMIYCGAESVAFSYLFPPTFFYQTWIGNGYNLSSYLANTLISIGCTSLAFMMIREVILGRKDDENRLYHGLNYLLNIGIANLCSTLCGNAVMYYFDHIDQFSTLIMVALFIGGTSLSAIMLIFQLDECFQVVTFLILSNLFCPLYFRGFAAVVKTQSDVVIFAETILLILCFYGITRVAEKLGITRLIEKILQRLTSPQGLLMLPPFVLLGYALRFCRLGKTFGLIIVLFAVAMIWEAIVFLLFYKVNDIMNFVMKSKRSRAVLFGVFSLLGILFCIYDLGKGGIYLASATMYALISIFAGVAAYKMWK